MSDIKLRKLPDRTPVKMTISLSPDLKQELDDYAAIYKATYGEGESIMVLIPYMLSNFIAQDRSFQRARTAMSVGASKSDKKEK